MTKTSYSMEKLSAFVDGELSSEQSQEIVAAAEKDPALADLIAAIHDADAQYDAHFSSTIRAAVPDSLRTVIASSHPQQKLFGFVPKDVLLPIGAAFAMGVAVAAIAPALFADLGSSDPMSVPAHLQTALDEARSGIPFEVHSTTIGVRLSFIASDGRYCRQFTVTGTEAIVCKTHNEWSYDTVASAEKNWDPNAIVMASGDVPDVIRNRITQLGASQLLDASGEKTAIENDWIDSAKD